jgi:putative transposase
VSAKALSDIREATNKAWVLGSERFKARIERKLERRVAPAARGGDRKSKQYRINRV